MSGRERQPHLFGAQPIHYRQGTAVANLESPPCWSPELDHDREYPYTLEEYEIDLRRWQLGTKVTPERQGALVSLAIGGAGRTISDQIPLSILNDGGNADFQDGTGNVHHSGVDVVLRALRVARPKNEEAITLQTGIESFSCHPRRDEMMQPMFLRLDTC